MSQQNHEPLDLSTIWYNGCDMNELATRATEPEAVEILQRDMTPEERLPEHVYTLAEHSTSAAVDDDIRLEMVAAVLEWRPGMPGREIARRLSPLTGVSERQISRDVAAFLATYWLHTTPQAKARYHLALTNAVMSMTGLPPEELPWATYMSALEKIMAVATSETRNVEEAFKEEEQHEVSERLRKIEKQKALAAAEELGVTPAELPETDWHYVEDMIFDAVYDATSQTGNGYDPADSLDIDALGDDKVRDLIYKVVAAASRGDIKSAEHTIKAAEDRNHHTTAAVLRLALTRTPLPPQKNITQS